MVTSGTSTTSYLDKMFDSISSPFESIPSHLQLVTLFLTAIVGFIIIIGFPSASPLPKAIVKKEPVDDDFADTSIVTNEGKNKPAPSKSPVKETKLPPRTPGKRAAKIKDSAALSTPTSSPKVAPSTYGSVSTPLGRRSARVAKRVSSAKK